MNKFKSFILFKGLDKDFKEYKLKQVQKQELKQKIEQEKDFLSPKVEYRSSHSYFLLLCFIWNGFNPSVITLFK